MNPKILFTTIFSKNYLPLNKINKIFINKIKISLSYFYRFNRNQLDY